MKVIYLDNASTTPIDPKVSKKMYKYMDSDYNFGNSISNNHYYGWKANEAIKKARMKVANIINASPEEIIFTSGATESNNLALKGITQSYQNQKIHIITSSIEHKSIINTCQYLLEKKNIFVTYLKPNNKGEINKEQIEEAIQKNTILISIAAVHNELGTYYPIKKIGLLCKKSKILFHVDGAQGIGKIIIDVQSMNIDLLSISAHKMYGPKGIGALYIKNKIPKIKIIPLIHGGNQEKGLRSGTLATHQIVGLGKACQILKSNIYNYYQYILKLRKIFLNEIYQLPYIIINTPINNSYPGILNITFEKINGESLIAMLNKLAISTGSACNSHSIEPSFVLINIGISKEKAQSTLRFSFGKNTSEEDIKSSSHQIVKSVIHLRNLAKIVNRNRNEL